MSPKEDPLGPLARAIADEVAPRLMEYLSRPQARLLTVIQTAAYLGRTEQAIRNMYCAGKLPGVKIDERLMFDVQDLDRMIEAAKNNP